MKCCHRFLQASTLQQTEFHVRCCSVSNRKICWKCHNAGTILLICLVLFLHISNVTFLLWSQLITLLASIVHSKLHYCTSPHYNPVKSQINYLQYIVNCLVHTVVKAPVFQPDYVQHLISVQSTCRLCYCSLSLPLLDDQHVESAPFFNLSTSSCSLSSWFTSSYVHYLITILIFAITICHSLGLSLQTENPSVPQNQGLLRPFRTMLRAYNFFQGRQFLGLRGQYLSDDVINDSYAVIHDVFL